MIEAVGLGTNLRRPPMPILVDQESVHRVAGFGCLTSMEK
jgi:hypothetical protein